MHNVKKWMKKHPVIAFFVVTYGASWPLFGITLFMFPGNMLIQGTLGSIATFGPVIAGIVVSRVSDAGPGRKQGFKRPVWFTASWLSSTLVLVLFIWQVRNVQLQAGLVAFSAVLALLPAYVLSCAFSRRTAVRRYLTSLVRPRGHPIWYAVALFTFPVVQVAGYALTRMAGRETGEWVSGGLSERTVVLAVLTFLHGFLFAGGLNEESGWRGFAIPRLQLSFSPLAAACIVWFFWALWHLPYDISSGDGVSSILTNRLGFNLIWSVLFVWIFNRTQGSILAPAVFHPAMNTFGELLPRTHVATLLFVLLAVGVVLSDRMWRRPRETDDGPVVARSFSAGSIKKG